MAVTKIVCQACRYTAQYVGAIGQGTLTCPGGPEAFRCKVDGVLVISDCPNIKKALASGL